MRNSLSATNNICVQLNRAQSVVHNRRGVRLVGAQLYSRVACPVDMVHSYSRAQSVRAQLVVLNRYRAQSYGAHSVPSHQYESIRKKFPSHLMQTCRKSIGLKPRLRIGMNPDQFFNPIESEGGIIRINSDWEFSLNHSDLGFIRIKNFFSDSFGLTRTEWNWILLRILNLGLTRIDF